MGIADDLLVHDPELGTLFDEAIKAATDQGLALVSDIDGCLLDHHHDPGRLQRHPRASAAVHRLACKLPFAFLTGRSVVKAWPVTGVEGAWILGLNGAEVRRPGVRPGDHDVHEDYLAVRAEMSDAVTHRFLQRAAKLGILVDDTGQGIVAFHHGNAVLNERS